MLDAGTVQLKLLFRPSIRCGYVVSQCRIRLHGQEELASGGQEVAFSRGAPIAARREPGDGRYVG